MKICELLDFLCEDLDKTIQTNKVKVTYRFTRFFNNLAAFHVMFLDNIVCAYFANEQEAAEELYEEFRKQYPEVSFNKNGDSPITKVMPGDIELFSIDEIYKMSKRKVEEGSACLADFQVFYAKNLFPLKDIQPSDNYLMHRKLLIKNVPELKISDFKKSEKILLELFGENKIMQKIVGYVENLKYNNYKIFLEHFFIRINGLYLDKNLKNPSNKEFFNVIQKNK